MTGTTLRACAVLCVFLVSMCLVGPVSCDNEDGDVRNLFSDETLNKVEHLLKNIPADQFAGLQNLASRVIGEMGQAKKTQELQPQANVADETDEFQQAILAAMKKEGLLDSWKKQLDTLIFDDNVKFESNEKAEEFHANLKCSKDKNHEHPQQDESFKRPPASVSMEDMEKAVHEMLGNSAPDASRGDQPAPSVSDMDVDYLLKSAADLPVPTMNAPDEPSPYMTAPKAPEPAAEPAAEPKAKKASLKQAPKKAKPEPKKKAKKKNEPLNALVGLAKQYFGQDENDQTLDIIADMAASYLMEEPEPKSTTKTGKKGTKDSSGLDLASMLKLASMFADDSPSGNLLQSLTSILGGNSGGEGMTLDKIIQAGSLLMGNSNPKNRKLTSPAAELVIRLVANFLDMDSELLMKYYTAFQSLVETNSWSEINDVLRATTGTDVETFLNLLDSDDVREGLSVTASAAAVEWLQHFLSPESLKTKTFYVNSFLVQYNYPPIDPKHLIDTSSVVIDRLVKDYLSYEIESRVFMKQAESQLKSLLHLHPSEDIDFRNYTQTELTNAVSHSVKLEFFDPLSQVWSDYKLAARYPKCARTILCSRNSPANVRTPLGLKAAVTRASSTAVVWVLSKTGTRSMPSFNDLYTAAFEGVQGHHCEAKFQENCTQILQGDRARMSLGFDHNEL